MSSTTQGVCPELLQDGQSITAFIPVPIPLVLQCSICAEQRVPRSRSHGSFDGKRPHISFLEHLRGSHRPSVQARFKCLVFGDVFPGLRQTNSHVSKVHSPSQVSLSQSSLTSQQGFSCSDCGSVHATQYGLSSHRKGCPGVPRSSPPRAALGATAASPAQPVSTREHTSPPVSPPPAPESPAQTTVGPEQSPHPLPALPFPPP